MRREAMKGRASAEATHEGQYENDGEKLRSTTAMLRDYRRKGRSSLKKFVDK